MPSWQHLYTQTCPPESANAEDINPVYRFVEDVHITEADFEPHRVKFPNMKKFQSECNFLGTSVYTDFAEMQLLQQKFPKFAKMKIAKGCIGKPDGMVSFGKRSHVTWWVLMDNPENSFQVLP